VRYFAASKSTEARRAALTAMATAGNKSLLPYRLGVGITGYTGFIPASENISIPVKRGAQLRAPLERGTAQHGDGGTVQQAKSSYTDSYTLTPEQFKLGTLPNPLYDINAPCAVGDPPFIKRPVDPLAGKRPFFGQSTFRDAYEKGLDHAAYPMDVTITGKIRPPGAKNRVGDDEPGLAQSRPFLQTLATHGTVPSTIESKATTDPFYLTETMQRSEDSAELLAAQVFTKAAKPGYRPPMELANRGVYGGVKLSYPEQSTSYRDAFGKYGLDPRSRIPETKEEMKFRSSTAEHCQGTTKASYHPPGYSGFIPETGRNPHATEQSLCVKEREGTKNFRLATLFQYPHQLPGYGGYRPQTAINDVGPVADAKGLSTMGRMMASGNNGFIPGDLGLSMSTLAKTAPMRSVHGIQGALHKEVFSHESLDGMLSENGRTEADKYYITTRPFEGRSVSIINQANMGIWSV